MNFLTLSYVLSDIQIDSPAYLPGISFFILCVCVCVYVCLL